MRNIYRQNFIFSYSLFYSSGVRVLLISLGIHYSNGRLGICLPGLTPDRPNAYSAVGRNAPP